MVSRRLVVSFVACAALGMVALNSGCFTPTECQPGDPRCSGDGRTYRPLTTPVAPLENLSLAYVRRDQEAIDQYKTLFDPDTYIFQWRQDPSLPPDYYGYGDEINATTNLFNDKNVTILTLSFLLNAAQDTANWGVPSDIEGQPAGTRKFSITQITLHYKNDQSAQEYQATGICEFYVAPVDTVAGVAQWRIVRWNDLTGNNVAAPFAQAKQAPPAPTGSALLQAAALADRIRN